METSAAKSATNQVNEMLEVALDDRDDNWLLAFIDAIAAADFLANPKRAFEGPDGLLYIALFSADEHLEEARSRFAGANADWCTFNEALVMATETGCGIAINPNHAQPDWLFPYGSLWSYREFNSFYLEEPLEPLPDVDSETRAVMTAPSSEYLPDYARRTLKSFIQDSKLCEHPGVLLLIDSSQHPPESLVFSVFREDFEDHNDFDSALMAIDWHLPPHYCLRGVPKDSELASGFFPL